MEKEDNSKEELRKLKADYNDFVYIVSHDLKAPLRAIMNLSTWIEDDLAEIEAGDVKANFKLLKNRVSRLEAMLNAILQISRIQRMDLEIVPVDLNKILEEVLTYIPNSKQVELSIKSKVPHLITYKEKLFNVFLYLIDNAVKFNTNEIKTVSITIEELSDFYKFSVEDNGIEIENLEKIFTIFYCIASKESTANTGAGLTIAKKIIEFVGGTLSVKSEFGKGSIFSFTWPKIIK